MAKPDSSAGIDPSVVLGRDVEIIGASTVGERTILGSRVILGHPDRDTLARNRGVARSAGCTVGADAVIRAGSVIYERVVLGDRVQTGHHAVIREDSVVGEGSIVGTHCVVEFNVHIGSLVMLHTGVATAENCFIGDRVWVSPNVVMTGGRQMLGSAVRAGTASVEELEADEGQLVDGRYSLVVEDDVRIGAGALLLSGIRVGAGSVIAAGAVVDHDVPPRMVVAGNPGRPIRQL